MKTRICIKNKLFRLATIIIIIILTTGKISAQQRIVLGLHVDPVISWFSSDVPTTQNSGARPGFNFGLTFNKYFTSNYAFSTGLSLQNSGGRLINNTTQPTILQLSKPTTVPPGESVVYKIQYLSLPIGLKLQTNQIGYITYFSDIGLDPKAVVSGKVDIPSLNISNERAIDELNVFNLSYHITAGIEYSMGGNTAIISALSFENNFLDITKDNETQPKDQVSHKMLSFRIGLNF
jgi:hypothetical protein